MRSCAFKCICQQWVNMGHPLCIYFCPAAGPSSYGWCVCVSGRETTVVWACTCMYAVFAAVAVLPHTWSVSEDVVVNLDPHVCSLDTVPSLDSFLAVLNPHCSVRLSWLSILGLQITSLTCFVNIHSCAPFLKYFHLLAQWVSRGCFHCSLFFFPSYFVLLFPFKAVTNQMIITRTVYIWYHNESYIKILWKRYSEIVHSEREREGEGLEETGRQTQRGHVLHPCHSLLSPYRLSDWWIMDEPIDRWAQLCSTDPLRTLAHKIQIWSQPPGKYCHIFSPLITGTIPLILMCVSQ